MRRVPYIVTVRRVSYGDISVISSSCILTAFKIKTHQQRRVEDFEVETQSERVIAFQQQGNNNGSKTKYR